MNYRDHLKIPHKNSHPLVKTRRSGLALAKRDFRCGNGVFAGGGIE